MHFTFIIVNRVSLFPISFIYFLSQPRLFLYCYPPRIALLRCGNRPIIVNVFHIHKLMFVLLLHFYQKEVFFSQEKFSFSKMTLFASHFPVADAMNTLWILAVIILGLSLRKYAYLFTGLETSIRRSIFSQLLYGQMAYSHIYV